MYMAEAKTNSSATDGVAASHRLTDGEYLRAEAENAKAALKGALDDAKAALTGAVDPREIARAHPFVALGSAAVAGFVAALVAIPSKEQQALHRIEKLQRAMHPDPSTAKETNGTSKPAAPSLLSTILKELIAILKPILIAAVTAGINPPAPPPVEPAPTDPGAPNPGPDNFK
jgi:hypothetical protein